MSNQYAGHGFNSYWVNSNILIQIRLNVALCFFVALWKPGDHMVSVWTLCCVLGQDTSLSQVPEWVPANLMLGMGCRNIPIHFMLQ